MSLSRKAILGTISYLFLVALLSVVLPVAIHRTEFDRAFLSWHRNQTPQNEALLRNQRRRNEIANLETSAILALVLWGAGIVSYEIVRRARR
jgi:hypothetical protein